MPPPREVELKLEVPAARLPQVTRRLVRASAGASAAKPATLVSVYFDTKKLKLRSKGLSLRVRRIGRRHVQTIKQDGGEAAGLFVRNEWERDIGGREPELDAARDTALEPLLK